MKFQPEVVSISLNVGTVIIRTSLVATDKGKEPELLKNKGRWWRMKMMMVMMIAMPLSQQHNQEYWREKINVIFGIESWNRGNRWCMWIKLKNKKLLFETLFCTLVSLYRLRKSWEEIKDYFEKKPNWWKTCKYFGLKGESRRYML